ncbi:unnamed protein product, partial [Porites lobata]
MVFAGTGINITTEGRKHLGAAFGQKCYLEKYADSKIKGWISECAISDVLIPPLTEHNCSVAVRKLLVLAAHIGRLGMTNSSKSGESEY